MTRCWSDRLSAGCAARRPDGPARGRRRRRRRGPEPGGCFVRRGERSQVDPEFGRIGTDTDQGRRRRAARRLSRSPPDRARDRLAVAHPLAGRQSPDCVRDIRPEWQRRMSRESRPRWDVSRITRPGSPSVTCVTALLRGAAQAQPHDKHRDGLPALIDRRRRPRARERPAARRGSVPGRRPSAGPRPAPNPASPAGLVAAHHDALGHTPHRLVPPERRKHPSQGS